MSRTAIIAVHGVADQQPGETAKAVAALLHAYPQGGRPWDGFVEESLTLPVEKLQLPQRAASAQQGTGLGRVFDERSHSIKARADTLHPVKARADTLHPVASPSEASLQFMYDQVCDYDPKSAEHPDLANTTYQTIRLSSQKLPTPESNPETVHVYEMFWADQSRLGNDWYQVLVGFYQMIFHVCSLGRDALDLAKEEFQSNCQWTLARRTHAVINFGLTLLAPVLNLCLLAVLLLVVPAKIPLGLQWIMAYGGIGVFAVGGWLAAMIHRNGRPHFNRMEWTMMAGGGLAALGVLIHVLIYKTVYWKTLAVEWVVVATVGVGYVLAIYSRSKPQVRLIGALCGLGTLALIGYELWICENSDVGIATAAIQSAVYVFLALEITWMAMALAVFVAMVAMYSGLDFSKSGRETRKTRALGTAFVSLMLPITLFVVVTIALYTPLLYLATPSDAKANAVSSAAKPPEPSKGVLSLPKDKLEAPLAKKLFEFIDRSDRGFPATLDAAPGWMFKVSVTTALPYGLFLWALAAFVAVYGFFWSILVESSRPRPNSKDQSKYVGENLTAGFGRLGLVFVLLFFVFPCVLLIGSRQSTPSNDWFAVISSLGAGLFLVFATGKLGDLIAKIWPPLDVILDVDNYLRVRPTSRNPKSRIFTRYRALLKFVSQQGYDRVLFVSHSQGTAITADFLRFLREYPDGEIAALGFGQKYEGLAPHKFPHLYLMTMGCPLRQLYGWRFPHLYQWSRHEGFSSGDPKSAAQDHHLIGGECSPDPLELGVRRWINAYSSGDYVGRHLWRDDNLGSPSENAACLYTPWNPTDPSTESRDAVGEDYRRRELCFGVGAHTHYFVDNGEQIARLIDEILR